MNKLDDTMEEVIVLVGDQGDELEFIEVAVVELGDKVYICLEPAEPIEGFADGDLLIFEIGLNDEGEEIFISIDDQEEVDAVFKEFLKMQNEEDED
ncbi:MAG: DUF1292 domain-containing protein [Clostridiales bacterium]|jgi:uncharacterized protein YrzB (UPF0473 family)|nr:DUF1292 domain-containing protein [Clostridiales bacterium]